MIKQLFIVLGLPRSGSTLLTNLINSQTKSFCVSEPLWEMDNFKKVKTFGKIKIDESYDINDIPNKIKSSLIKSEFDFGGYKETFRHWQNKYLVPHINDDLDFIIRISRDPIQNYGSWKKKSNWGKQYSDVKDFSDCFNSLKNLEFKKIYDVQYEKIIEEGIDYLNDVLPIKFDNESLKPSHFTYGDSFANSSKNIKQPEFNTNVTKDEINYLKENIDNENFIL